MIATDVSGLALPGKQDEAIAVVKEIAAYYDRRWPLSVPRVVVVDLTGEMGRIHLITRKASLAEHEQQVAEQNADATSQALGQQLAPLTIPGSSRTVLRRII